jgi:hypothetical protein
VQFKFLVVKPSCSSYNDDEEAVKFEEFNRTLLIPADGAGMLLEPAKPFVFGVLGAESDLLVAENDVAPNSPSRRLCRTPSMMAAAADASMEDMYRVPSLLQTVSHRPELIINDPDADNKASDIWDCSVLDRQVSCTSELHEDMPMVRQESVMESWTNGTLSPTKGSSGFRRSAARFSIVRFWVQCETSTSDQRVLVVGDHQALGKGNPEYGLILQNSARYTAQWISTDILCEVPPKGAQPQCVKYRLALQSGPDTQPTFEDHGCERFFFVQPSNSGQLLEPSSPDDFGCMPGSHASMQPRLPGSDGQIDAMQDEVRPCGRSSSAAELADVSGFARKRSDTRGASIVDLQALAG